jgi:sugar phosphate isomerase/epimerase
MGAKFVAVHGDEFDFDNMEFSPEAALEHNRNMFLPYVKEGEKCGFKMAFETVFQDRSSGVRFTSDPKDLLALIKSFESENAVCCWDFGHAHVSFKWEAPSIIRDFGSLIQCTHLHDNTGEDSHQIPLTGDIRWGEVKEAFDTVNYKNVMSIEYSHGRIPENLAEDFLRLSYRSAKQIFG